jgi:anti-sigma B factor antagonist
MDDVGAGDSTRVVAISGELDSSNVKKLRMQIDEPCARLVLDLSGLTFIDSAGAAALLAVRRALAADGRTLVIVLPSGTKAYRLLKMLRLTRTLPLVESLDAACERLATPGATS